ncbi:MAG: sigma-70 family RNA polymerase sigma factor [Ruminococcaceae bacterium]|nr:sigma-70 family RNA polymerase sigma factor [Oscillospiraceae bacterium]
MHLDVNDYQYISEEELASSAKAGDSKAANELVSRLYLLVSFAADRYSALGIEKADLVQEGMLAVLNAIRSYKPEANAKFKTYANTCVYNHYNSLARKVSQKKQIPQDKITVIHYFIQDQAPNPEESVIEKERLEEITAALRARLSDFEYEVLNKYLSGYSAAEIAEIFGITVKRVSNALYRIRQKFHFILK